MRQWTTVLAVNNEAFGKLAIRCMWNFSGRQSLPLLFVTCLALVALDRIFKGHQFSDSSTVINHVVFMDDIKSCIATLSRRWNH